VTLTASNPRGRSDFTLERYVESMIDAASLVLDEHAPAREREQARRRFELLHREASARYPALFADEKGN